MDYIHLLLKQAKGWLEDGELSNTRWHLHLALDAAKALRSDVPRNRCLRAYIAQALEALK